MLLVPHPLTTMQELAHYLAARHGCPAYGDSLAALLTALQNAHDNGDTLTILDDNAAQKAPLPAESSAKEAPPPITAAILATLAAHGLIGDGSQPTPLVRRGDRLWYYRNYQHEARLAAAIHARLATGGQNAEAAAPAADPNLRPEQQQAVALARRHRLTLINGAKTYSPADIRQHLQENP